MIDTNQSALQFSTYSLKRRTNMQDVLSLGFFLSLRNFYKRRFEIGVKIAYVGGSSQRPGGLARAACTSPEQRQLQ
ncbi:hypothetical protein F2P81_017183 [Scophthalmus maximus]|uniref:Uncharacterized protein n=1 Tax=Scophthalmus maximus TaxID=52904 RepID=A0A6A4SJD3_SCOMX|nr:hypothetical protein F2P81_017183 [Scophthalmus maximus]